MPFVEGRDHLDITATWANPSMAVGEENSVVYRITNRAAYAGNLTFQHAMPKGCKITRVVLSDGNLRPYSHRSFRFDSVLSANASVTITVFVTLGAPDWTAEELALQDRIVDTIEIGDLVLENGIDRYCDPGANITSEVHIT